MARLIPGMKEAVEIAGDKDVYQMLWLIQNQETKQKVFALLKDKKLQTEIRKQQEKNDSLLLEKAIGTPFNQLLSVTTTMLEKARYDELVQYEKYSSFYEENKEKLITLSIRAGEKDLSEFLSTRLNTISAKIYSQKEQIEQTETAFADAVFGVKNNLFSVKKTRAELAACPDKEFDALINALNGGYIPASSGGDPVATPETVPTF